MSMHIQRGASLLVVLIALAALLVGSVTLLRHTSVAQLIAGNTTRKQAASNLSDLGVTDAIAYLQGLANKDANAAHYFALRQVSDAAGLPQVDWTVVPSTAQNGYAIQYLVDRMCQGALPVVDPITQCATEVGQVAGASNKANSPQLQGSIAVYYRITVRVTGPQRTESYVQALISN